MDEQRGKSIMSRSSRNPTALSAAAAAGVSAVALSSFLAMSILLPTAASARSDVVATAPSGVTYVHFAAAGS